MREGNSGFSFFFRPPWSFANKQRSSIDRRINLGANGERNFDPRIDATGLFRTEEEEEERGIGIPPSHREEKGEESKRDSPPNGGGGGRESLFLFFRSLLSPPPKSPYFPSDEKTRRKNLLSCPGEKRSDGRRSLVGVPIRNRRRRSFFLSSLSENSHHLHHISRDFEERTGWPQKWSKRIQLF